MNEGVWVVLGVLAGIVFGACAMYLSLVVLTRSTPEEAPEPITPSDLSDSGGYVYATKDDGPIHRSEAWWRSKGAK